MNRRKRILGLLLILAALPVTAAMLMAQDGALEARLAYVSDGAGGYEPWGAIGSGGGPGYPLKGVLLYCKSGSTTALCLPSSGGFDPTSNQSITGTWSFSHSIAANGGIVVPAGQNMQVTDSASAASGFNVTSFGTATVYASSQFGNAAFNVNTSGLGGFFSAVPFGTNVFTLGYTGTNGLGLSDSLAGDTLISAPLANTIRIGPGTASNASMLQVSSTHVTVPSQKSTTGQRYVCIDTSGNIVSSATACVGT